MKQLLGLLAFTLICGAWTLQATPSPKEGSINWLSWSQARTQSALDIKKGLKPKKVLVDFYTTWCVYCKVMDTKTYTDARVAEYINANFYPVKFDAQNEQEALIDGDGIIYTNNGRYHDLAGKLTTIDNEMMFPTTVFLDENFKRIYPLQGYVEADEFHKLLSYYGSNAYQTTDYKVFVKRVYKNQ